jgi:subfamily B ATP-binding cassette protein MsbA
MEVSGRQRKPDYGKDMNTYRRLLFFTRPYRGRLVIGLAFGGVFAIANAGILAFLKQGLPKFYDETASMEVVILTALMLPLVGIIRGMAGYLSQYQIRWVGSRVVMDLRNAMFRRLNELSLSYFVTSRTGELISRTTNDTMAAENAVSVVVEDIAKQPLTLIGAVGWLIWIDPWLALISLVLFPVCILPVALFGKRVRRFTRGPRSGLRIWSVCFRR